MNSTVTHNSISLSDILSFYKEELGSDDANYVSLVAALHGSSKMEALIHVADDVAEAHRRALRILSPLKDACDAYAHFSGGLSMLDFMRARIDIGWRS